MSPPRSTTATTRSRRAATAPGSNPASARAASPRSTGLRGTATPAPVWGWRSASASWSGTAAPSGSRGIRAAVRCSSSPSRPPPGRSRRRPSHEPAPGCARSPQKLTNRMFVGLFGYSADLTPIIRGMGVERTAAVPGRAGPRPVTLVVRLVVFSALSYVAFLIGRDTVMASADVSVIWPLSGVGLVWLTSGGRRLWLLDAAGLGGAAGGATVIVIPHAPRVGWIMAAVLTVLQPVVYVLVMRRVAPDLWGSGGTRAMSTLRDLGWFVVACLAGSLAAGVVLGSGLGLIPGQDLVTFTMTWVRNFAWMVAIGAVALQVAPA